MIEIKDKKDCCGCSACVQKCPKQCISLKEDDEGFLYPVVDKEACIDCGLCEKVCPVLHQGEPHKPLKVYAAKNQDEEIRRQSSSGGIFTLLAEKTIQDGGVVFGARFDEHWEVKHDYTETIEGLAAFRGSKYVQSRMEDNYRKAEMFLKQGRKVLFSGTPCQVAGLKRFLRKEYEHLLTVDFICHGVPSPGVWRKYLKETVARMCDKNSVSTDPISMEDAHVESISFRDKSSGWKKYSFALTLSATSRSGVKNTVSLCEVFPQNTFMKGFLSDLYLRPSCYACAAKSGKSGSDITIGDLWGAPSIIGNEDDDKGTSLVLINKDRCKVDASLWMKEIDYQAALTYNPAIEQSVRIPKQRTTFYIGLDDTDSFKGIVERLTKKNAMKKGIILIKKYLNTIFVKLVKV